MTAAWNRLAFIAACAALILAVTLAARYLGGWVAVGAALGGVLLAVVLAQDWGRVDSPDASGDAASNGRPAGTIELPERRHHTSG